MQKNLSELFPFNVSAIPLSDITTGRFKCTSRFGYTEDKIYREAYFQVDGEENSQRGVLVFDQDSRYIEGGKYKLWRRSDAVLAGPSLLCSFSLCNHFLKTNIQFANHADRQTLPCALIHSFETDHERELG